MDLLFLVLRWVAVLFAVGVVALLWFFVGYFIVAVAGASSGVAVRAGVVAAVVVVVVLVVAAIDLVR